MAKYKKLGGDRRYATAKILLEGGHISTLKELVRVVPKTIIAIDIGMKGDRMTQCLAYPAHFYVKHLIAIAKLLQVDLKIILTLVYNTINNKGRN